MKKEYDFSRGERGKFFRPDVELNIPVYLEPQIAAAVREHARKRNTNVGRLAGGAYIEFDVCESKVAQSFASQKLCGSPDRKDRRVRKSRTLRCPLGQFVLARDSSAQGIVFREEQAITEFASCPSACCDRHHLPHHQHCLAWPLRARTRVLTLSLRRVQKEASR